MICIGEIRKQDYKKAQQFAIDGMHLNWYLDKGFILDLYSKYFWHMELNRATKVYGAYADGKFVGVLLADINGEAKPYCSFWRTLFVRIFDILQHIAAGEGVGAYDKANQEMFSSFCRTNTPDGEIVFLAADPYCKIKGIGTALLSALEASEKGKLIYLYTDNACTYQFYEHRGFTRSQERDIVIDLKNKRVPLKCLLYSKTIQ
ncbi:MAG: GNAT family N-acetyltransferase [Eubacteriales bacterium]|nr:GNAT family N-acetyltransferase [Eubacteriales bacterium]